MPYPSGHVLLRDNSAKVRGGQKPHTFALATDDAAIITYLHPGQPDLPKRAKRFVTTLGLRRRAACKNARETGPCAIRPVHLTHAPLSLGAP